MIDFPRAVIVICGPVIMAAMVVTVRDLVTAKFYRHGYIWGPMGLRFLVAAPIGFAAFGVALLVFETVAGIIRGHTHPPYSLGTLSFVIGMAIVAVWKLLRRPFKFRKRADDPSREHIALPGGTSR